MDNAKPGTGNLSDQVYALLYICGLLKLKLKGSNHILTINSTLRDMCLSVILVHYELTS